MGTDPIRLTLSVGPSLNAKFKNRNFENTDKWQSWKNEVAWVCISEKITPFDGAVGMKVSWFRKQKKGDIDSKLKALLDALQKYAYHDDKQVEELEIKRFEDPKNPRMEVTVYPLENS